jgi:hypothetical protein
MESVGTQGTSSIDIPLYASGCNVECVCRLYVSDCQWNVASNLKGTRQPEASAVAMATQDRESCSREAGSTVSL